MTVSVSSPVTAFAALVTVLEIFSVKLGPVELIVGSEFSPDEFPTGLSLPLGLVTCLVIIPSLSTVNSSI